MYPGKHKREIECFFLVSYNEIFTIPYLIYVRFIFDMLKTIYHFKAPRANIKYLTEF